MRKIRAGLIVVRGAGDLATGIIVRLMRSGFRVVALETEKPSAIRRTVAFADAVYEGEACVEGITARLSANMEEIAANVDRGIVALAVDPRGDLLPCLGPAAVIDAIMAKRNLGTNLAMAPIVVAIGPGFIAGRDAHAVVETMRGHDLGRVLLEGSAEPNTGIPGLIEGRGADRVIHAPSAGTLEILRGIGQTVESGEPILALMGRERTVVASPFRGTIRGMLREGFTVPRGMKIADVDPRCERRHCFTISDKARAIAGGALEAMLALGARPS